MSQVRGVWAFTKTIALRWYHDSLGDLAAGVTFWILVSLPAAVLALLSTLASVEEFVNFSFQTEVEQNVLEFVTRVFIDDNGQIKDAVSALFKGTNSGLLTVSLAVALWSISRGFAGLIRALEDIYLVEHSRPWYHTRVVAVILGLGSMALSIPLALAELIVWDRFPAGPVERFLKIVASLVVLIAWAATIFHFAPPQRSRWRHDIPGAITAAVGWWLLSFGFGSYVQLTSPTSGVAAAVGAGLLALTWLWLAAQVLLIGGTVNVLYAQNHQITRDRGWVSNPLVTGEHECDDDGDHREGDESAEGHARGDSETNATELVDPQSPSKVTVNGSIIDNRNDVIDPDHQAPRGSSTV